MSSKKGEIQEYVFADLSGQGSEDSGISSYEFVPVEGLSDEMLSEHQDTIRTEKRAARQNNFYILPEVKEARGINAQNAQERKAEIEQEVAKRVDDIKEQAFKEGYENGQEEGKKLALLKGKELYGEQLERVSGLIDEVLDTRVLLLKEERDKTHRLIKNLTKWIVLRELQDDGDYIRRLLERLILETKAKSNIMIKVDEKHFKDIPEMIEHLKEKVGELQNTKIEATEIEGPGIILDTENGIVDGTLQSQFKVLDKLFGSVGLSEIEEVDIKAAFADEEVEKEEQKEQGSEASEEDK